MKSSNFSIFIVGVLFFIFGFITWLNGSLVPYLREICDLDNFSALLVTFSFYIAYTIMALPSSFVLDKIGFRSGISLGLIIMSFGAMMFIPAAYSASYIVFLIALFILATGLTLLQSASNPYIVYLGEIQSAAKRIAIMGIINKTAGVIAPILFSVLVFVDDSGGEQLASKLVMPYIFISLTLLLLTRLVKFLPDIKLLQNELNDNVSIFSFAKVVLGAVALFFYVGIEVIAGDTIGLYAQNLGVSNPSVFTSYTMFFMVVGYVFGVFFIPKYISTKNALAISAISGIVFIVAIIFLDESKTFFNIPLPLFFVALLGLSNAMVWPSIWPLALDGVGAYSSRASALLIMAIAGGAILPLVFGKISESFSMQQAYAIGIICYIFILLYALKWHKKMSW